MHQAPTGPVGQKDPGDGVEAGGTRSGQVRPGWSDGQNDNSVHDLQLELSLSKCSSIAVQV